MKLILWLSGFLLGILLLVGLSALGGFIFMLLWNVIAEYFEFKTVTFVVAWAICFFISMINSCFKISTKEG
jgi:hypothetical protein